MLVYNYHPDHGAYTYSSEADEDPLTPGEFLIPAHATTVEPPTVDAGMVAVWDSSAWGEVEDHRGETWWTPDGQPVHINAPGDPADTGLVSEQPIPELPKQRFALVKEGLILQVIEWDANELRWESMPDCRMVDDPNNEAKPGGSFDGSNFTPPPEPKVEEDDTA